MQGNRNQSNSAERSECIQNGIIFEYSYMYKKKTLGHRPNKLFLHKKTLLNPLIRGFHGRGINLFILPS